jgi:hypothetical protein
MVDICEDNLGPFHEKEILVCQVSRASNIQNLDNVGTLKNILINFFVLIEIREGI